MNKQELAQLVVQYRAAEDELDKRRCEKDLAYFLKRAWTIIEPGTTLQYNWHIDTICGYLAAYHNNELPNKRLIINIPPGALKSVLVSVMYPAWIWCTRPDIRILAIANADKLATRDSIRMKQIVTSEWYQKNWPLALQVDQNEKTLFVNEKRGLRQSQGITACVTGVRGDLVLLDDLLDSRHAFSDILRQNVNDTWDQTLSTRINDPTTSGFILVMQRLSHLDITGHLLKKSKIKWTHLSIPMRYEGDSTFNAGKDLGRPELNDPRTKKGELLFPQRFTEEAVQGLEEDLGEHGVSGQLQQRPSPLGGGILKKHWWRIWPEDAPLPVCTHIFHSWDTAFSEADSKNAAYSAMTRWGVFWHEQRERYCIMGLGMWYGRIGFEELRAKVKEFDKKYKPDRNLIEKKATGITLVQELRRASPGKVTAYTPGRGEDKISRAHSVSPMLESGIVYVPAREWALGNGLEKLGMTDYAAIFPAGGPPSKDVVDTITQALIYMRSGQWAGEHDDDHEDHYEERKLSEAEEEDAQTEVRSFYG